MEELTLTTPALLFSAVSLILLAYTNRFLSYAQLVRTLKEQHLQHPSKVTRAQIDNLRRRLHLTRTMQILGVTSLFLCVVTMFLIYVGLVRTSAWVFGCGVAAADRLARRLDPRDSDLGAGARHPPARHGALNGRRCSDVASLHLPLTRLCNLKPTCGGASPSPHCKDTGPPLLDDDGPVSFA